MEKEKKGLFGRLLDFWKEKVGMGETDSIGFWKEAEPLEKHFSEIGAVDVLNQQEREKFSGKKRLMGVWEEKNRITVFWRNKRKSFLQKRKKKKIFGFRKKRKIRKENRG